MVLESVGEWPRSHIAAKYVTPCRSVMHTTGSWIISGTFAVGEEALKTAGPSNTKHNEKR